MNYPVASACVAALLLMAGKVQAQDTQWISRGADSELGFSAWYEGEELPGRFERFEARLQLDDSGTEPRSLTVGIEVGSADMNDRQINEELGKTEWFDTAAFPRAEFSSSDIRRAGTGYLAAGRLRLKGIDKALEIPLEWRLDGDSATLTGTAVLMRRDWQVGAGEWASDASLSDRVELRYRVTLTPER